MGSDLRFALRTLRRSPGFTAVAVISLALGIGANTAIFSLMYTVMLRRLPVAHPEQLVELLHRLPREGHQASNFSEAAWRELRDRNSVLSGLIASAPGSFDVRGEGIELERVDGAYVDGSFFGMLGVKPVIGRLIGPEDDRAGNANVAVVSWPWWHSRFDADRGILGKRVFVQDAAVTIVGVLPRGFEGWQVGTHRDVWLPLSANRTRNATLALVGRLRPGVSMVRAHAELSVLDHWMVVEQALHSSNPYTIEMVLDLEPAGAGLTSRVRQQYGRPLSALMAVVGLLLLIACTNIASLLLARGAGREREMAVRVALGAGRLRLVRQVLTESLLLAAAGSVLGIGMAYFGTSLLVRIIVSTPGPGRIEMQARPDFDVLVFTAAAGLLTGLLFGIAPALRASASTPAAAMRGSGRAGETRWRRLFGKGLVAAQVALSLVLLSGAALFVRHLANLENLDLGFRRDHLLLATLDAGRSGYDGARLSRGYQELLVRLEAIPGVRSASLSAVTPISGAGASRNLNMEGYQASPGEVRLAVENWVAPRYFETLGTPILAGRDFRPQDQGGPWVAIVNRTMARYYFGDHSALGRHVTFDGDDQPYEIVGVVGDAKYEEIREETWRTIYLDAFQTSRPGSQFLLRTSVPPGLVAGEVRRAAQEVLKTVPVVRVTTMAEQVDASIVPERLIATLSGLFGGLGAMLAAVGLYGLLAYTVARRTSEIGIRMALGATRGDVTRMVLRDALGMVAAGLMVGVPVAVRGGAVAAALMQGLSAKSGSAIGLGAAAMAAVALAAASVPARRAAGVDPMDALRYE